MENRKEKKNPKIEQKERKVKVGVCVVGEDTLERVPGHCSPTVELGTL